MLGDMIPWYAAIPQILVGVVVVGLLVAVLAFAGVGVVHVLTCP